MFETLINFIKNLDLTVEENNVLLLEEIIRLSKVENLSNEEEKILSDLKNMVLEFLVKKTNSFVIYKKEDFDFDEGLFVNSLEKLEEPYNIHEHYYQNGDITQLIEWYYTGNNGLKYRRVIIPDSYKDTSFLVENSIINERQENLDLLLNDESKFEI